MNNNSFKIVADSSSDVLELSNIEYEVSPLKIITDEKEYIDNSSLAVDEMVEELLNYTAKSSTTCPAVGDWLEAFGDSENIFCVTITSNLSGSYNSACIAGEEYMGSHPGRRVFVVDSLSAGPEIKLIIEKLQELIQSGLDFDTICKKIVEYKEHTGLIFMLESLQNLANNGRVSKLVANAAGILGIRVLGKASDEGTLEPMQKKPGERLALPALYNVLKALGYKGGKVRISHCCNENAALKLKEMILRDFKKAQIEIYKARGLVSFYAEKGGLLLGFEKNIPAT